MTHKYFVFIGTVVLLLQIHLALCQPYGSCYSSESYEQYSQPEYYNSYYYSQPDYKYYSQYLSGYSQPSCDCGSRPKCPCSVESGYQTLRNTGPTFSEKPSTSCSCGSDYPSSPQIVISPPPVIIIEGNSDKGLDISDMVSLIFGSNNGSPCGCKKSCSCSKSKY